MERSRRGNYNSGEDFVLEYGELRFTFNERDFSQRCEQAAIKVGFVGGRLGEEELEDLVNLAVNGEISDPASALGEHVNDCWPDLVGPSDRSLVHWLRRLIFRGAWLDQRVKECELDIRAAGRSLLRGWRRADRARTRALLGQGRLPHQQLAPARAARLSRHRELQRVPSRSRARHPRRRAAPASACRWRADRGSAAYRWP